MTHKADRACQLTSYEVSRARQNWLKNFTFICPGIKFGRLNILLAQQRGYLRTMINAVVDGLDQHDEDRSIIGSPIKMENLIQVFLLSLLSERDQLFSRHLCSLPQFIEAWKMREVRKT